MRIKYLEAADVDHLQQLVEHHQQLALELLATLLVNEHALDLVQHIQQHVLGVGHHQGTKTCADDDDHLGRLPEHGQLTMSHDVATQHAGDDDQCT